MANWNPRFHSGVLAEVLAKIHTIAVIRMFWGGRGAGGRKRFPEQVRPFGMGVQFVSQKPVAQVVDLLGRVQALRVGVIHCGEGAASVVRFLDHEVRLGEVEGSIPWNDRTELPWKEPANPRVAPQEVRNGVVNGVGVRLFWCGGV